MPSLINSSQSSVKSATPATKKPPSAGSVFQESIYNLIPKNAIIHQRPPRHRSVYAGLAREEYKKSQQKSMATIGPSEISKEDPHSFLKKKAGHQCINGNTTVQTAMKRSEKKEKRQVLPLWQSHKPTKSPFVKPDLNVEPLKRHVIPAYRFKKDYGKAPNYLFKRKDELEQTAEEKAQQEKLAAESQKKDFIILPEEERLQIVQGLQKNWEKLTSEFQKMPLVIDTVPKINRKLNLERQLKKIEEDLDKFSHQNIVIKL